MNDAVIYLSIPAQTIHTANMGEDEFLQEVKDGLHGSIPPGAVIDGVEILQPVDVPLRTAAFGEGTRS